MSKGNDMAGYYGGKVKLAKHLIPIILKNRKENQYYVEPFCGACGVLKGVTGKRIANDINHYLIALYKHLQNGGEILQEIDKSMYNDIIHNRDDYPDWLIGETIFYSKFGRFLEGWLAPNCIKSKTVGYRSLLKDMLTMMDVEFYSVSYSELIIPDKSIIYCDPPYINTKTYRYNRLISKPFIHEEFYAWCLNKKSVGHDIFISEYQMPEDIFECVFEKEIVRGIQGKNRKLVERLFVPK